MDAILMKKKKTVEVESGLEDMHNKWTVNFIRMNINSLTADIFI